MAHLTTMQLELTSRDVTIILQALAQRPYHEVAALIRKIVWQDSQEKLKGDDNT